MGAAVVLPPNAPRARLRTSAWGIFLPRADFPAALFLTRALAEAALPGFPGADVLPVDLEITCAHAHGARRDSGGPIS